MPPPGADFPPPLHELEAEVMEELWSAGEAPVRQALDSLNARSGRARAYTTIMTIMVRLRRKGLLSRRREGKTDVYSPTLSREAYRQARAEAEVAALVEEFGDVALAHFASQVYALDPQRRRELRRLAQDG
jgi:predicted transcriptional regulator